MVKRSFRRNQRVGKKRSRVKKSKTKNYSRKRFYKISKRLMRGGWGSGGGKHKMGGFYQTGGWGAGGGSVSGEKPKYGGNHHQYGGNPLSGGWGS